MIELPTILLLNESNAQLNWMAKALDSTGMRAIKFNNTEEALAYLRKNSPPTAIVTDVHMPGIDGWRFCRLVRSPEFQAVNAVPILAVSDTFAGAADTAMT